MRALKRPTVLSVRVLLPLCCYTYCALGLHPPLAAARGWSLVIQSSLGAATQLKEMGAIPWSTSGGSTRTPTLTPAPAPAQATAQIRRTAAGTRTVTVEHDPTTVRQTVHGFGGAFTEAAGYSWKSLTAADQQKVLELYWGGEGLGYTTGRVAMNSPDFALSDYSYANVSGDMALKHFDHTLARDNEYVLPLLRAALRTSATALRLFSAPWSPPAWMKKPFPLPSSKQSMAVSAPDGQSTTHCNRHAVWGFQNGANNRDLRYVF